MPGKKIKVALLFGGRSAEHEISRVSALSIWRNLDPKKYEVIPIAIGKDGQWRFQDARKLLASAKDTLPVFDQATDLLINPKINGQTLVPAKPAVKISPKFDVVFPALHGPMGEDGTVQGLLELLDTAYVGCGVLASSVAMDKDVAFRLAAQAGLAVPAYHVLRRYEWNKFVRKADAAAAEFGRELGFPVFVKPARLGSSVGVSKIKTADAMGEACREAFRYDDKIIIEKGIDAREIECAVLGDHEDILVSAPGEVIPKHEFYSYEAKYIDPDGAQLKIPAQLTASEAASVREAAKTVFLAFEGEGMARVDFLLDKSSGVFYFGEINTIPGFTSISMYPKMMEASGVPYARLLDRLIELAMKRKGRQSARLIDYQPKK